MGTALQALADGPDGKILVEMDLDKDYHAHSSEVVRQYSARLGKLSDRIAVAANACNTDPVNAALRQVGLE